MEVRMGLGWGGRIRTSTVCINSAASYQLDHAPAGYGNILQHKGLLDVGGFSLRLRYPLGATSGATRSSRIGPGQPFNSGQGVPRRKVRIAYRHADLPVPHKLLHRPRAQGHRHNVDLIVAHSNSGCPLGIWAGATRLTGEVAE